MCDNLTAEQWQAIAKKLAEYLKEVCCSRDNCNDCTIDCALINQDAKDWIKQVKQELGYE